MAKLILASGSPRRAELLHQLGAAFEVQVSEAEELRDAATPRALTCANARAKAEAVARRYPGRAVLGADTVVALDEKIYGKPGTPEAACAMLGALSGRSHTVTTGLALINARGEVFTDASSTEVVFAPLSREDIATYVATGEPLDKAGGYAVQGRAAAFIEAVRGSFSGVVGLPLCTLAQLAKRAGVDLYDSHGAGPACG